MNINKPLISWEMILVAITS